MTVGDIIKVTELSTGNTHEARIVSGSPSAGLYSDDHRGTPGGASGVQWTPKHRTHIRQLLRRTPVKSSRRLNRFEGNTTIKEFWKRQR